MARNDCRGFYQFVCRVGRLSDFCKKHYSHENIDFMLNIAAGIMLASSVFTLLAPAAASINQVEANHYLGGLWIVLAVIGGVGIIWILHEVVPHEHEYSGKHGEGAINMRSSLLFILRLPFISFPRGWRSAWLMPGRNCLIRKPWLSVLLCKIFPKD